MGETGALTTFGSRSIQKVRPPIWLLLKTFPPLFFSTVIAGDSQTQDLPLAQARAQAPTQAPVRSQSDPQPKTRRIAAASPPPPNRDVRSARATTRVQGHNLLPRTRAQRARSNSPRDRPAVPRRRRRPSPQVGETREQCLCPGCHHERSSVSLRVPQEFRRRGTGKRGAHMPQKRVGEGLPRILSRLESRL